jgi:hypothetical protein
MEGFCFLPYFGLFQSNPHVDCVNSAAFCYTFALCGHIIV